MNTVMGSAVMQLVAALPIREQPSPSPSTAVPEWLAFSIGLALGVAALTAVLLLGRRRRRRRPSEESRTWAAMDDLCGDGWTAQLTLYGDRAPLPDDAPDIPGVRVRVEWAELEENEYGEREVAVARRFWSRSVGAALRTLVQDRDLDHQLEEIERAHTDPRSSG
jgi:hypothetical protein